MNRLTWSMTMHFWRVPILWHRLCHYANHVEKYTEAERWAFMQELFQLSVKLGNIELLVAGQENLPEKGGFMLYSNHQGKFDANAIVASCARPLGVVMKKELATHPFFKRIIKCTNSFAMDRESVRQSLTVINNVIAEIKKGRNYLIFPEGEANRFSNAIGTFKHGSFRCATKTGCPVVPVALVDCFKPMDQQGHDRVTIQVHYLPPIYAEEYRGMSTAQLAELVKSRIEDTIRDYADPASIIPFTEAETALAVRK